MPSGVLAAAAGAGVVAALLLEGRGLRGLGAAVVGVGGEPGRVGAGFLGVVGAQDARDVAVVGRVAVVFVAEEGAAEGGVAGGGVCEEVGEVGGHCGWWFSFGAEHRTGLLDDCCGVCGFVERFWSVGELKMPMLSVKPSSWGLVVGQAVARLESPGAAVQTTCNAYAHA